MKYALIGCGRISPNHIQAAMNNNLEIAAICDINPANMDDKKAKFELPDSVKLYTDYKEMIEHEKPELVAIATESGKHATIALDCIEKGCNVIIEKPIALSLEDADKIIATISFQDDKYKEKISFRKNENELLILMVALAISMYNIIDAKYMQKLAKEGSGS